jgi:hypothetical protein
MNARRSFYLNSRQGDFTDLSAETRRSNDLPYVNPANDKVVGTLSGFASSSSRYASSTEAPAIRVPCPSSPVNCLKAGISKKLPFSSAGVMTFVRVTTDLRRAIGTPYRQD